VARLRAAWAAQSTRRRWALLGALALVALAIKLTEDVITLDSGPVDTMLLWFVRDHVPPGLSRYFAIATRSGSSEFLLPVTVLAVTALLIARRRAQALLLGASMLAAPMLTFGLKGLVGRARPAFWDTQPYWGSSFPSGHSLATAAFATAGAICLGQMWPRSTTPAMILALLWSGLVALSRLVLGVHWPSDVLAAVCLGMFVPLAINLVFDLR
jgi:undecaprenyl-diphosphatase